MSAEGGEHAVLVHSCSQFVGDLPHLFWCIAHRDADRDVSEHLNVVVAVTDSKGVGRVDLQVLEDRIDAASLVDART